MDFEKNYIELKSLSKVIITKFYNINNGFNKSENTEIETKREVYNNYKYRFRHVVYKYFLNVTFDFRSIPYKYVIPIMCFYLVKKIHPKYRITVKYYIDDFIEKAQKIKHEFPGLIERQEDISQQVKLILASSLVSYINTNKFYSFKSKKYLHKSYLSGYYFGLSYLISDKYMDNPNISLEDKTEMHEYIIKFLSDPNSKRKKHILLDSIVEKTLNDLPYSEYKDQYEVLYYLQKVQWEDYLFKIDPNSKESIVEKLTLMSIKTYLSLYIFHTFLCKSSLLLKLDERILYSLLVQLDDDLRDISKDKEQKIETLFTLDSTHLKGFCPHVLYIKLVNNICEINPKLNWLYADYFKHIRTKPDEESLDNGKLKMFFNKLTKFHIESIYKALNIYE